MDVNDVIEHEQPHTHTHTQIRTPDDGSSAAVDMEYAHWVDCSRAAVDGDCATLLSLMPGIPSPTSATVGLARTCLVGFHFEELPSEIQNLI
jgi:hypothetical protein